VADASYGNPSGGIIGGTSIDFTINWDQGPVAGYSSHFTGKINDEGFTSGILTFGNRQDNWSSSQKFSCITPSAPPAPAPAPAARLAVVVKGPTTLATGLSGTYTASLSNSGDVSALVELYISFGGQLQQTGQVIPSGGFNCGCHQQCRGHLSGALQRPATSVEGDNEHRGAGAGVGGWRRPLDREHQLF
jgi:hypothetical protein